MLLNQRDLSFKLIKCAFHEKKIHFPRRGCTSAEIFAISALFLVLFKISAEYFRGVLYRLIIFFPWIFCTSDSFSLQSWTNQEKKYLAHNLKNLINNNHNPKSKIFPQIFIYCYNNNKLQLKLYTYKYINVPIYLYHQIILYTASLVLCLSNDQILTVNI